MKFTPGDFMDVMRVDLSSFTAMAFDTINPGTIFVPNYHIDAIATVLQAVECGDVRRLIISMPPRNLKSICSTVAFPAWMLGRHPSTKIICASYASGLSEDHARSCREVMQSDWYRRAFPATRIDPQHNRLLDFATTLNGRRIATSVGGTLTGRGADILIIDDPLKADEALSDAKRTAVNAWYDQTLYSRLDNPKTGAIIIVTQRLHVDDLVGHVLDKEDWTHLRLPAIAETRQEVIYGLDLLHIREPGELLNPEHQPIDNLEAIKRNLGTFAFAAQYQQDPLPIEGNLIRWEWFVDYTTLPPREPHDRVYQSWDTAFEDGEDNDWSVGTTWLVKGNDYYLVEVVRKRMTFPGLKKTVIAQSEKHATDGIIIERKGSGIDLYHQLREEKLRPFDFKPEGDKVSRMHTASLSIEAGQVHIPKDASWLSDFKSELLAFPYGHHDDQVDSVSQFLMWKKTHDRRRSHIGTVGPEIIELDEE